VDCGEDFDSYNFVFFPYPDVVGDYFMGELERRTVSLNRVGIPLGLGL
jgi:hypothetical protein